MAPRSRLRRLVAVALPASLLAGCFDEPPDRPDVVFLDALEPGVAFEPFLDSKYDTFSVDSREKQAGNASARFAVPTPGEPGGGVLGFAGGAFTSSLPRDLSRYTALTFWARASRNVAFDVVGLANDNTGTSRFQTELRNLPLTTSWTRFVLPIPAPEKLTSERGLLWFADGADGSPQTGYQVWLDEIVYQDLDPSSWNPRPVMTAATARIGPGDTHQVAGTAVTHTVDGVEVRQAVFPATFDYSTSDTAIATVNGDGLVTAVGTGTATISASLGGVPVPQVVTVEVAAGLSPTAGPPAPTVAPADVLSIFSDAYDDVPVNSLGADWSNLDQGPRLTEVSLAGDAALKYTDLLYVGIEFTGDNLIDASAMTHVHVDAWTRDGTVFKVKLVDFGADGAYQGGDDEEHELTFDSGTSPALVSGQWIAFDLPLSSFTNLTGRAHLAQLVLSSSTATVFVDNVYFHR
jgi:hypothetical protein